jgi:K+-sensing histidine kinase KdpD
MGEADENEDCARGEALLDWLEQGAVLTRELADENRRLLEKLRSAEDSHQRLFELHAEIEERHNELANLYVASYQLRATFDPQEVVAAISEIVINLIGAEVYALYACNPATGILTPVACEGRPLDAFPTLLIGQGVIGQAVANATVYVAEAQANVGDDAPVVVIPLHVRGSALGVIALYKLLDQKASLSELDHQLFDLLASHAATALVCSRWAPVATSSPVPGSGPIDRITN